MSPGEGTRAEADLTLRHQAGETRIFVGSQALERAAPALGDWARGRTVFLVHPEGLEAIHAPLLDRIDDSGARVSRLPVPDGEEAKSLSCAESLWSAMLAAGGTRDSRVIAAGGGSSSDVAGFVAATFLRGIELALLPTTLLAQVDAAIGGKTAIDLPAAKNCVGAFWHPAFVVAETRALGTLDAGEWRSGMVEVVKIAAAADPPLFEWLETDLDAFTPNAAAAGDRRVDRLIGAAIAAKQRIVEADPTEGDSRRVLNLGHTLGHAIETALGYHQLRHGEAVAYGLLFALRLAADHGGDPRFAERCRTLLSRLDLPALPKLDVADLVEALRHDKKARRDGLYWVLPVDLGRVEIRSLPVSSIAAHLEAFLASPLGG